MAADMVNTASRNEERRFLCNMVRCLHHKVFLTARRSWKPRYSLFPVLEWKSLYQRVGVAERTSSSSCLLLHGILPIKFLKGNAVGVVWLLPTHTKVLALQTHKKVLALHPQQQDHCRI